MKVKIMKITDPPLIAGTFSMIKQDGQLLVAFCPDDYVLNPRKKDFFAVNERAVARMLYRNGLIDEPQLFELIKEGRQEIMWEIYPATLISAIVLGLPEEPNSIDEIKTKFVLDAETTKKFEALSAHFIDADCPDKFLNIRAKGQYPYDRHDRNVI
jgi:hypothetical protein